MEEVLSQQPIRSVYKDGLVVISNVKSIIDNSTTSYTVVLNWYDGTTMDDSKIDQWGVYSKYKPTGEYLRENKPQWGELFLEVDTINDLRNLSEYNQLLVKIGYFKGVRLNGFYSKGDTPYAVTYLLSTTTLPVDAISIIQVGDIKLEMVDKSVDLFHFGAVSDGNEITYSGTDNRQVILSALDYISRKKGDLNINGKFFSSSFTITQSDLNIFITASSFLIFKPSYTNTQDRSLRISGGASNITISGMGAKFVSPEDYTTGEWRHVVTLLYCTNVSISGIECIGGGGDGWNIGNDVAGQLPTKVTLTDVKATRNYRNGISFINGHDVSIIRPTCKSARGTLPKAGIDIEANKEIVEEISGLRIIDPITEDNSVGLLFTMGNFTKLKAKTADIIITGHQSIKDDIGAYLNGFGSANPWVNKLTGYIKYQGSIVRSKTMGMYLAAWDVNKAPTIDIDVYVEDAGNNVEGDGAPQDLRRSPIVIFASYDATFDIGNYNIKAKIRDTRATPLHYTGVYLANDVRAILNTKIEIDTDQRRYSNFDLFSHNGSTTGSISFKKQPDYTVNALMSLAEVSRTFGGKVFMNTAGPQNIPSSQKWIGNILEFEQNIANTTSVACQAGDSILIDGAKTNHLVLMEPRQSVRLLATKDGWQLIGGNFMRASTWPNRPAITSGTLPWFNKTDNKWIFWNGTAWVDIIPVTATPALKGIVNQSLASTDSAPSPSATYTQSEVQSILNELRDLKTKLRTAGILAS
ncbi:hypothetical protein AAW12_08745 [Sphingobacterium sp. Ag1]|uniref:hypothetical protein n=1 Tax=Sphingobacterium sp. Ag1 TaxID=1643451 RepID=UPI000627B546|nr:hypothetical protein [Sphingobacterium sp. Ag1]KKO91740.1 hypothetical protein AAW12_08745 [Sphingobacterium sp. Ag1]